jgi:hypothetical protein
MFPQHQFQVSSYYNMISDVPGQGFSNSFVKATVPAGVIPVAAPTPGFPVVIGVTHPIQFQSAKTIINSTKKESLPMATVVYSSSPSLTSSESPAILTQPVHISAPPAPMIIPIVPVPVHIANNHALANPVEAIESKVIVSDINLEPSIKVKESRGSDELKGKCRYEAEESGPLSRIRVWLNEHGLQYYDCECGKRKPVQDLYKIKQHVLRHEIAEHVCPICTKTFKHHLQMNAHMKVHKRAKLNENDLELKEANVEMDLQSVSPRGSSGSQSKAASPVSSPSLSGSRAE